MRVRFVGRDTLGYKTGQVYDVQVRTDRNGEVPRITWPVVCPYGSWDAFWANWELPTRPTGPR